ncbi:MAG: hypothetical protein EB023_14135 [Flavobacteriia bacterium]|nr:hypothetical protein [Flavobacteriia bacterium]
MTKDNRAQVKFILLFLVVGFSFLAASQADLASLLRQRFAAFRSGVPAAPAPAPIPAQPTFANANLGDTIWRGILTLSTSEIAHFKENQKQQYSVTNPSVSAIVEIWFPTATSWFCVMDLTEAKSSNEDGKGIYNPKRRIWEPLIGTAPDGLVGDDLPLSGYVGSGSLNHSTNTFEGGRDNNTADPNNDPECLVLVNGSYSYGGSTAQPTLIIRGTSQALPAKREGVRVIGTVTGTGTFTKTDRLVSQEKNRVGGFSDTP